MKFVKPIVICMILCWSCATTTPKIPQEVVLDYCDRAFVCIGSRIDEYAALAFKDPDIKETNVKIAAYVCDAEKAKISLRVVLKMTMKNPANPDAECVDAILNLDGNVHYFDASDTCGIGIVT